MTVKPCNRPAVGGHRSGDMQFVVVDVFVRFNAYFACFDFSQVVHKLGVVGT